MSSHPLLNRQFKRLLEHLKESQTPANFAFLKALEEAYEEVDSDRTTLERALEASSRELLQAKSDLRALFKSFPDLFFRLDRSGRILDCKGGDPAEFLVPREQLPGKRIQDIPIEATRTIIREALRRAVQDQIPVSVEYSLTLGGVEKFYELRLLPAQENQLIGIARDITERRESAEALVRQRAFLRQIIDQNPNFIFAKDQEGRFTLVNQAMADSYGMTVAELLGKKDSDVHGNPDEAARFREEDREVIRTFKEKIVPEQAMTDVAGNVHWVQTIKRPILSPDGREQMVLGVAMEITKRKLAEESLRKRTEQILKHQDALHELTLASSDGFHATLCMIATVAAKAVNAPRVGVWLFNADRSEMIEECCCVEGQIIDDEPSAFSTEEYPLYLKALEEYRTLAIHDVSNDLRLTELKTDYLAPHRITSKLDAAIRLHGNIVGAVCHEQTGTVRRWTIEEEHFVASLADLVSLALAAHERRNLEAQLRQSQKMEAVGMLAGGIAHDFSNLLTVLLVYADLLAARLQGDSTALGYVDEIQGAAERAESLIQQLLAFSRKQVLNPKILDLNEVICNMEGLLRPMIGEDIDMITSLVPDLAHIKGDRGQIEQVLMNLAVNARDAMPAGGRLKITTSNVGPGRPATPDLQQQGNDGQAHFVTLTVSDNGIGMDEETLSRIYEPFFTTKQDGRGSGLGLSTVYGIVDQSGGQIEVESSPGVGTTFRIYFPAVANAIEAESIAAIDTSPPNRETILLVEDEDSLRQAAVHALREQGYKVFEVRNGIEALEICRDLPEDLHLLITDVVMPRMDGRELAAHVTKLRRETRILYVSGYAKGAILDKGSLEPNAEFLAKPFRLAELIQKVREVLHTVAPSGA